MVGFVPVALNVRLFAPCVLTLIAASCIAVNCASVNVAGAPTTAFALAVMPDTVTVCVYGAEVPVHPDAVSTATLVVMSSPFGIHSRIGIISLLFVCDVPTVPATARSRVSGCQPPCLLRVPRTWSSPRRLLVHVCYP